jgi:hypothetical protein
MEATIGRIITARISPAASIPKPYGAPWKIGRNPRLREKNGSMLVRIHGTRTKIPQRPYTMLGMPARSSMRNDNGRSIQGGASSERKIATPRLSGSAITNAIAEETRVPNMNGSAP